jgi:hypothetical protein
LVIILASLLGAVTGGLITYFINTRMFAKNNHIRTSIINKTVIYNPLLIEFKRMCAALDNEEITSLSRDLELFPWGANESSAWFRIKNDTRYYQLPDYYKNECETIESLTNDCNKHLTTLEETAKTLLIGIVEEHNVELDYYQELLLFNPLKDYDQLLFGRLFAVEHRAEVEANLNQTLRIPMKELDAILTDFSHVILGTQLISNYRGSEDQLSQELKKVIETTETIIERITGEYELRNHIF